MGVKSVRQSEHEPAAKSRRSVRRPAARAAAVLLAVGTALLGETVTTTGTVSAGTGNPSRFVNTFAGTDTREADFGTGGGAGNTFPGAVAPFGMLQWSPDTVPSMTNFAGGYTYTDSKIRGFSLTHLSGVGCPIFWDIPFLPTTVPVTASPSVASSYDVDPSYLPSFSHRGERARPGYYRVWLDRRTTKTIRCELTATPRTGFGRFTYPATTTASMLINAGGSAMANGDAVVEIDPDNREVSGWVESGHFCFHRNRYRVYFTAQFSQPFSAYGTWKKDVLYPGSTANSDHAENPFHLRPISGFPDPPHGSTGAQAGAYVSFDTNRSRVVEVRVSVSFVSVENARENLRQESPTWNFTDARRQARDSWNEALGHVEIRGGHRADKRTFYTMLYHAMLGPTIFSDVNGQYVGMEGQVHTTTGFTQYTSFSGWDVYRSQIPLLALLFPERTSDMIQSLLTNARESGWLPRWSVANSHTNVMTGDPAAPTIASAHVFGARDFELHEALQAMLKGATQYGVSPNSEYVERAGLPAYLQLGYVPHEGTENSSGVSTSIIGSTEAVWGSAATTLEYTTADFAIARYAAALGDATTCETFMQRSSNWKNLFNAETNYIQPRFSNGLFKSPFDPASGEGWVEGSGAQYTWMVPHDLEGLFAEMGGAVAATERLDEFFTELNDGPASPYAFLGNEPSAHTPWIYTWLGQPYKTQEIVRQAILTLFDSSPTGYPGNDDVGQMSSWYIFGAIGLYPEIPGVDVLALGSPLFRKTYLHLPGGTVTILAANAGRGRPYVRSVTLNGVPHTRPWIRFRDIENGGTLIYDLASSPNPSWGSESQDLPPSFAPGQPDSCATTSPAH